MDSPPAAGAWVAPLAPDDGCTPVPDDPLPAWPEADGALTEVPLELTWLTVDDAVLVAPEVADCAAELAVETAEWVAELAVDTADCTVDETALVAVEVETGGDGTDTEEEPALTFGVETDGSPEARLADAPEPTMAAGANVRAQTRISDFERFIEGVLCLLTRGGAGTFAIRSV